MVSSARPALEVVAELRREVERIQGTATCAEVPVHPALRGLLDVRSGGVYAVETASLALLLLAGPSAQGSWCGIVGMRDLGVEAAAAMGVDPARTVVVPDPGNRWLEVTAALVDVLDLVVVRPPAAADGAAGGAGPWAADSTGLASCCEREQPAPGQFDPGADHRLGEHRRDGGHAVRLGLTEVQGIGEADAERIVAARAERPFASMADVVRRAELDVAQMESLATAGAFDVFGISRRQALWSAGYVDAQGQLEGTAVQAAPPMLPGMSAVEETVADLWATRISPDTHPMEHLRSLMREEGVLAVGDCAAQESGRGVRVAGLVTHRQRPYTASGVTFLNLEDETGMLNVVVFSGVWQQHRRVLRGAAGLVVRGKVENVEGATNLVAERVDPIESLYPQAAGAIPGKHRGRDFQ